MRDLAILRAAASACDLLALAREAGVPDAVSLRGTGIDARSLDDPLAQVQTRAELRLIANVRDALPDRTDLGLDAGSRCQVRAFGMIGLLMISSPTLRDALMASVRYQDLCYPIPRSRIEHDSEMTICSLELDGLPADLGPYLIDHQLAALASFSRQLGAELFVSQIELQQPSPPHAARYVELIGKEPRFGAESNRLLIDNKVLDESTPLAKKEVLDIIESECEDQLERRRTRVGIAGVVRGRLERAAGVVPNLDTVAADLNYTPRTLRRMLAAEDTSFRELDADVRLERSRRLLLADVGWTVGSVASELGYSSSSAFTHAFRKWTGMSPKAYARTYRA